MTNSLPEPSQEKPLEPVAAPDEQCQETEEQAAARRTEQRREYMRNAHRNFLHRPQSGTFPLGKRIIPASAEKRVEAYPGVGNAPPPNQHIC